MFVDDNFDVVYLKLKNQITCIILTSFFMHFLFFILCNALKLSNFFRQTVVGNKKQKSIK